MKRFNLFFLITTFALLTQMCNKNVKSLKNVTKDDKLDIHLLSHIIKGKEEELKNYLDLKKDINLNAIQKGQTYLNYAINSNNAQIIKLLISSGANPNIFMDDNNILLAAFKNNKVSAIFTLINSGTKLPEKSNLLLEIIHLNKRMRSGNFEEEDYRLVLSLFKNQIYLNENWENKIFNSNELFEIIYFIAPFESMNKELNYLLNEKKIEINLVEPKEKKGLTLYQAISKAALSNIKLLLQSGADISDLKKNRPIELLFTALNSSFQRKKSINEKLLVEVLNLILSQIDTQELESINNLKICKNILIKDQFPLLKTYINFNNHISKAEILNLIIISKLKSTCFEFLLEKFKKIFSKEDIVFELAKELVISRGLNNKNISGISLGKSFEEISDMLNYFLKEKEFVIESREKMLNSLSKIIIANPSEEILKSLEENYHDYIISTKGTNYSLAHAAAKTGDISLLKWCLKFSNIDDRDQNGKTVIEAALQKENENVAHFIIQIGAVLTNENSNFKQFVLPEIKGKKSLNNKNLLKSSGKNSSKNYIKDFIEKYYVFDKETLIKNVKEERLNVILYVLNNKIFNEINYIDIFNKTALDYAVELGFEKIAEVLIKYGCLTYSKIKEEQILRVSKLEEKELKKLAAHEELKKSLEVLRILPEQKVDLVFSENEMFFKALDQDNFDSIISFLKKEPSKILKILNNASLIEKILKSFPEISTFKDKDGNNLLMISIINNYFETVIKIINSNLIDIKETDSDGNNLLMLAALWDKVNIFEFLINKMPDEAINNFNIKGKNVFGIAVENRNTKFLNLISKKSCFNSEDINEIAIDLILSFKEKEKLKTLKTILNIMKENNKNFKKEDIEKLKEAKLSKEILETLSKFSEEFKTLLQNIELGISNTNENFENEAHENSIVENVKLFSQNSSFLDEWESFINSSDEKIITNLKIFKDIIEDIKTSKKMITFSKKIKFISKNLYEIKVNRSRIFYSIKDKDLVILGVILYKDETKSSKAIEYLKENIIKFYEKWETKKFADLEFAN